MEHIEVTHRGGDRYAITIRDHEVLVDQRESGDAAPSPTELFVASLASCTAFYTGRFLQRHAIDREGLRVSCEWSFAEDRPARVADIHLRVDLPGAFPAGLLDRLQAVVEHCTVHNSIVSPPAIAIDTAIGAAAAAAR